MLNYDTTEAERCLVGLALLDGQIPIEARPLVADDFFDARMRAVWTAFQTLDAAGQALDPLSAVAEARKIGSDVTAVDLMATYTNMARLNPAPAVAKVRTASQTRKLMRVLSNTLQDLSDGQIGLAEAVEAVRGIEVATEANLGGFRALSEIIEQDVAPVLATLAAGKTLKIRTGFAQLDRVIGGGLSPSDVMVVAALTGAGKSAFSLQLAYNLAVGGFPVAFLSGEMTDLENGLRLLTQTSGAYNLNAATYLHRDQYQLVSEWAEHIKNLPLYFDSRTFDLRALRRTLKGLVESKGIRVLVVDYLQLFRVGDSGRQSRTERIAEASQEVRRLALELSVAVIEVVQFNREGSKSGLPGLHDLEGSGQLEKDASIVLIIDREEGTKNVTLRIVKGRNAPKTEMRGTFDGPSLTFELET